MRIVLIGLAIYLASLVLLASSGMSDRLEKADVALVLGNLVYQDGSLSPWLEARVQEALRRYQQGYFPLIVVSGCTGGHGYDEAGAMKRYLLAHGVPASAVIEDRQGINTYASAANLRQILRQRNLKSVMVVTQYFHVPRTRLALRRFGITAVYSSHARYYESGDFYALNRELAGYLRYATRRYPEQALAVSELPKE